MKEGLEIFFNPKSVAIIGASNKEGKVGNALMKKMIHLKGTLIPINNHEEKILEKKAYKSVLDYPKKIDLAVIAIPAKAVPKILEECNKKNIKNIIILSAGFSEIGNYKLEEKVTKIKDKYKLNILGPNCFGIINPKKNIDLTFSMQKVQKGNTVFLSQSGALLSYVLDLEIKLRGFISFGNRIDLDFSDFIEYFSKDKKVKKIVCYIESLKKGKEFIQACKNSKKEIIVVKSGKTEKGLKATLSHTGSLGTESAIYSGAFTQARIKESNLLLRAFGLNNDNLLPLIKGDKVAIITNAGGAGALLSDILEINNFEIYGPRDILGTAKAIDYQRALNNLKGNYDSILVVLTPQAMSEPEKTAEIISNHPYKEKIIACFLGGKSLKEAINILTKNKVSFCTRCV